MQDASEEHRMLEDSLNAVIAASSGGAGVWSGLAELGMLGLTLPEAAGGAALGLPELMLFSRAFGRAGAATPYLGAEILAMPLLAEFAGHSAVAPVLGELAGGTRIATLALADRVPVTARRAGGGYVLEGVKTLVPAGAGADIAVLSATLEESAALFMVDLSLPGIGRTPYIPRTAEAGADIALDRVELPEAALLASGATAEALVADAEARGRLAVCADMLGAMEVLLDLTADYLRTREQFGRPLAAFQALQHAAVDMYVELETARAMLDYGCQMFGAPPAERARALDAVKLKINSAARSIGESAVQLHGGIGMTQESLTGRLFARLTGARLSFGDSRECLNRLIAADVSIALT